jgi:nicotinate phosphoribosyltransferase
MAYKLVSYGQRPVTKLSTGKAYLPGRKQVYRLRDPHGHFSHDIIGLAEEDLLEGERLLQTVMSSGRRTVPSPTLDQVREILVDDFKHLDDCHKRLYNPPHYPVEISAKLQELALQVRSEILAHEESTQ